MRVSRSAQTCALGAAICGAVAGGAERGGYRTIEEAQAAMCGTKRRVFRPTTAAQHVYDELYGIYRRLHDAFGRSADRVSVGRVMKGLIELRERVQVEG